MPITFQSQATARLVMVQAHAEALLNLLGKTAAEPGIIEVHDMPRVLAVLRGLPAGGPPACAHGDPAAEVPGAASAPQLPVPAPEADLAPVPAFADEPVSLRQRAAPFVRLVEQALAGNKPIVWGV